MQKQTPSGPAIFMYSGIALAALVAAVCLSLYYTGITASLVVLWTGIVFFMILYQFGLRILFGEITKRCKINYRHPWYRRRAFEPKLYKLLRVRKWKDKVLTFDPAAYDFQHRTLEQLAATMAKSELDHWFNVLLSIGGIFFTLLWGCAPAFWISSVLAILFDAQFIVVQRYNRPIVVRLMERRAAKAKK